MNWTASSAIQESAAGSAQFYVFVGVIVFLYCLAALVLYVLFDTVYRKYNACTYGVGLINMNLLRSDITKKIIVENAKCFEV